MANRGRMYEVRINADPDAFLDWDAPLADQSNSVQMSVSDALIERGLSKPIANHILNTRTGRDALVALERGEYAPQFMPRDGVEAAAVSRRLRESGIPGIKYLDAGSRASGQGSRNYVVFDDSLIEILRKYGVAGLAALPAGVLAGMGLTQEQAAEMDANRAM